MQSKRRKSKAKKKLEKEGEATAKENKRLNIQVSRVKAHRLLPEEDWI